MDNAKKEFNSYFNSQSKDIQNRIINGDFDSSELIRLSINLNNEELRNIENKI